MLRILCLHGYRQNDQIFRKRTGAFRKLIKNNAELVFIAAPNCVPPLQETTGTAETNVGEQADERGWWFSRDDGYYMAQDVTECCKGYDQSLEVIRRAFEEQGPFDGILAFSQGAAMLSLLCSIRQENADMFPFYFAIFVAGFKSRSIPHQKLYETQVDIPTLHVFGDTDGVISREMSEELLCLYQDPVILQHPGGHFVPASSAQKKIYVEFLQKMITLKTKQ